MKIITREAAAPARAFIAARLDEEEAADQTAETARRVVALRTILAAVDKYLDPHPGYPCTNVAPGGLRTGGPCYLHVAATGRVSVEVLPLLAAIWRHHPDYDEQWLADCSGM